MKQTRLEAVALRFGYWMILLCTTAIVACASSPLSRAQGDRYPGIRSDLIYHALAQLGAPYVWGGVSPEGFDCSGLVQYSYAQVGLGVPRTSEEQLAASLPLDLQELLPGDLVFFNTTDQASHVGIYLGDGAFIHAPSTGKKVTIANIENAYWREAFYRAGSFLF